MPNYLIKPAPLGTGPATDCFVMIDAELPATSPSLQDNTDYEAFELSTPLPFVTSSSVIAPTAFSLPDLIATQGTGPFVIDLAMAFSGTALSYSCDVPWAEISGTSLIVEDDLQNDLVTVTAQNSAGSASLYLNVVITAAPAVPGGFDTTDWALRDLQTGTEVELTLLALPDGNGHELSDVEYRLDGGAWVSLGSTATGAYTISGLWADTDIDVELRALNSVGAGPASVAKEIILASQELIISEGASYDEIIFNADSGLHQVEIFAPSEFIGTYTFNADDLQAGPINLAPPAISGVFEAGQTLTYGNALWVTALEDGPVSLTPDWQVGGVSRSTAQTYTIAAGDATEGIVLELTGTNAAGTRSAEVTIIPPTPVPLYTQPPVISGTLESGQTVTMSTGDVTADEFQYRWLLDGTPIPDATNAALSLPISAIGSDLSAESRARMTHGDWSAWQSATGGGTVSAGPAGAYIEQAVVTGNGTYLELRNNSGGQSLALETPHFMAFVSVAADAISRHVVMSWNNTEGKIDMWNTAPPQMRVTLRADAISAENLGNQEYAPGERVSLLIATYPNGPDLDIIGYTLRAGDSDWTQAISHTISNVAEVVFDGPFNVFARNGGATTFSGTAYRVAAWAGTAMPDITQPGIRDTFMTSSTQGADPSLAEAAYGPALIDLYGPAADWNAALNHGSLTGLVKFGGDFTDAN